MTDKPVDYTKLLTPPLEDNPLWYSLFQIFSDVANPAIQNPREQLAKLRDVDVDPAFASLNIQMLGLKLPYVSFTDDEYNRLMRYMGMYIQTGEASVQFVNFISYVKDVPLTYVPLWANDLDNIDSLTDSPGTSILDSGDYFPTPFYDIYYSIDLSPDVSTDQLRVLLTAMAPGHLVLRNIITIEHYSLDATLGTFASDEVMDEYSTAIEHWPRLDFSFILDSSRVA